MVFTTRREIPNLNMTTPVSPADRLLFFPILLFFAGSRSKKASERRVRWPSLVLLLEKSSTWLALMKIRSPIRLGCLLECFLGCGWLGSFIGGNVFFNRS